MKSNRPGLIDNNRVGDFFVLFFFHDFRRPYNNNISSYCFAMYVRGISTKTNEKYTRVVIVNGVEGGKACENDCDYCGRGDYR